MIRPGCSLATPRTTARRRVSRQRAARGGLSLLEVIIALAVLAGSAAVIAQMVEMAVRRSTRSEERTEAVTLCHNLMNELVAGVRPWQNMASPQPVDLFSPWDYQVTVEPLGFADLAALTVVVSRREGAVAGGAATPGAGAPTMEAMPSAPSPAASGAEGAESIASRDRRPTYRWSRWVRATLPAAGRDARGTPADGSLPVEPAMPSDSAGLPPSGFEEITPLPPE